MAYKRAMWHSGLLYQQLCPYCRTMNRYNDYSLGFRAWYPDGFVYCAKCRKPLRHHEGNAINEDGTPYYTTPVNAYGQPIQNMGQPAGPQPQPAPQPQAAPQSAPQPQAEAVPQDVPAPEFVQDSVAQPQPAEHEIEQGQCPNCGRAYKKGIDNFCSGCGTKLDS